MARNYDNYGYEYENKNASFTRRILIIILVLLAIFLILFLVKSCNGVSDNGGGSESSKTKYNYENLILEAGKEYFSTHNDEVPSAPGECGLVDLQTLITNKLIDEDKFNSCNVTTTFLNVCMLDNRTLQYTPWISCTDKFSDTVYGDLREGSLSDVIVNETYTEFKFLPQKIASSNNTLGPVEEMWKADIRYDSYKTLAKTTYYRYRDKLYKWKLSTRHYYTTKGDVKKASDVNEYYPLSPKVGYTGYSDRTSEAYKWYTTSGTKVYYPTNGGYATEAQGEYKYHEDKAFQVIGYSSRYVTGTRPATYYYACATSAKGTKIYYSLSKCGTGNNPSYKYTVDQFYSCAQTGESVPDHKTSKSTCPTYSEWSSYSSDKTKACNIKDTEVCRYKIAYLYKWYKLINEVRSYYPSKSTTASGEKVYYTKAPVKGAQKDTSTKTNAYKWYSETTKTTSTFTALPPSGYSSTSKTGDYRWSDWSSWSTKNPKTSDGRTRQIETKTKIKLQQIIPNEATGWQNLSDEYLSEEELINTFKTKGYDVKTLDDIYNNGEIRYQLRMYIRNKKESK